MPLGNFGVYMKYRYCVQQYTDINAILRFAMRAESTEQLDRISLLAVGFGSDAKEGHARTEK